MISSPGKTSKQSTTNQKKRRPIKELNKQNEKLCQRSLHKTLGNETTSSKERLEIKKNSFKLLEKCKYNIIPSLATQTQKFSNSKFNHGSSNNVMELLWN